MELLNQEVTTDDMYLHADNLLDQYIANWKDKLRNDNIPDSFKALRFILLSRIDPSSSRLLHRPQVITSDLITLSDLVCMYANLLDIRNEFPLQAKEIAQSFSVSCESSALSEMIPKAWIQSAQNVLANRGVDVISCREQAGKNKVISAQEQWDAVLKEDPEAPQVMKEILGMIGIEDVKCTFIKQYHRIKLAKEQGDGPASSYNVRFEGNPGTGKTTVARHYGGFLKELTVLPESSLFIEAAASSLILHGVQRLEDDLKKAKQAKGAVVFIDEAYQLMSDKTGKQVLDFILPLAESLKTEYGLLVWIFAGYQRDMEKLFEHNLGLPSRFPFRYCFQDYEDDELQLIFNSLLIKQPADSRVSKPKSGAIRGSTSVPKSTFPAQMVFNGSVPSINSTRKDRFGHDWTWNGNAWQDKYFNVTGYGPDNLGSFNNPLISKDGVKWTVAPEAGINGAVAWVNDQGDSQDTYPGSPRPVTDAGLRETPFRCEDEKSIRIAMRRLGRQRGQPGFGNARAVRILFDRSRDRQAERIKREKAEGKKPNIFLLKREDLLGSAVTESFLKKSKAYHELQLMEGLAPVKESVETLVQLVISNSKREEMEKPLLEVAINRVFLGNPGTGKTTVAKLYGLLLAEMGLLSKGEVILKNPSDFVGDVLGSSEKQTRDILRSAEGCVLVIDEAYSLYSGSDVTKNNDPYKTAVIDTIVEQVQGKPGDDRAVVLLGYKEEMERFFKNVNPGLSRRFQLDFAFHFPDYDDPALLRILLARVRKADLDVDLAVAKLAIASLAKQRSKPHFGNAGAVENMLSEAKLKMQKRAGGSLCNKLTASDFGLGPDGPDEDVLVNLLNDMLGCNQIKEKLESLRATVLFAKDRGDDPKDHISFNYLFVGNPGTGKTTVAPQHWHAKWEKCLKRLACCQTTQCMKFQLQICPLAM